MTDITFIPTAEGWLYLAVILDLYSRRIVGWAMAATLERQLVLAALRMALETRQPEPVLLIIRIGAVTRSVPARIIAIC